MTKVILNIANNYFGSTLYENLLRGQVQIGFYPKVVSFLSEADCKKQNLKPNILLLSEPKALNKLFKLFPFLRFYYHKADIIKFTKYDNIYAIHSHTVHSNGSLGHLLAKFIGCKHIVSVRNTDVNYAFKYLIHLRYLHRAIMRTAYKITTPNSPYEKFVNLKFRLQTTYLPNPIDRFWEGKFLEKNNQHREKILSVCTLGGINKNKNQLSVIRALGRLKCDVSYSVIGKIEDKNYFALLEDECRNKGLSFQHVEHVENKEMLLAHIRRSDIMCLPSFRETFGLAYIESAMAGVPVVYSKNQGIDGILEEGQIGYSANPSNIGEICKAIMLAKNLKPTLVSGIATERFGSDSYITTLRGLYA